MNYHDYIDNVKQHCAYHHSGYEFERCSCRGVLNTTLCDRVCQVTCDRSVVFSRNDICAFFSLFKVG
jgi:hypothetical protein